MQDYQGGCHCERVRYKTQIDLTQVITCNCSICSKRGSILGFVAESQFTLLKGEKDLSDYQFNKKNIHHLFCKTCGIMSFGTGTGPDGMKMVAINVRCLDEVDITELKPVAIDGKSF